jgi:putative transcriptional regulator
MDSLAGKLLVAAPDLGDSNFSSTVVLVVDHDDEGAFGLVLNRESTVMLASAW